MFLTWLINFGFIHDYLFYLLLIVVSFFEGPILSLACGLLYRLGYFSFLPMYLALMAGDLIGDVVWYWLGHHFGHRFVKKYGKYFQITEGKIEKVETLFHGHTSTILIVSKLTMGFGFALVTLFTAGMVKIPFRKYIFMNFMGQFFWTGFLMSIGYFLGHLYATFDTIFARVSITALLIIVVVALFQYARFIRSKV